MIGRISGTLLQLKPPMVLVDVAGVGYEIGLPIPDCALLNKIGETVVLYTHLIIREDAHSLYGFINLENRECFRSLIKVSGIGPRIALALLSTLTPSELEHALEQADITTLCRTPGIGKKMAERMVLELKGKLHISLADDAPGVLKSATSHGIVYNDIANALASLGYGDKEINKTVKELPRGISDLSLGIKEALRLLSL